MDRGKTECVGRQACRHVSSRSGGGRVNLPIKGLRRLGVRYFLIPGMLEAMVADARGSDSPGGASGRTGLRLSGWRSDARFPPREAIRPAGPERPKWRLALGSCNFPDAPAVSCKALATMRL